MHLKRSEAPLSWSIPRKGTKFLVVSRYDKRKSIPLLILLRDILRLAKNRKEVKKILKSEKIKVNEKIVKDEKYPLLLFDILKVEEKNYKIVLKNKKFRLEETKQIQKVCKIIGKKILSNNKIQLNLNDGRNFISKEKVNVGDSVVIDFKENKIVKILPLKENAEIIIMKGKHLGEEGKIENIDKKNKTATILLKPQNSLNFDGSQKSSIFLKEGKINLSLEKIMMI